MCADIWTELLDELGFGPDNRPPIYQIYYKETGLPVYCRHCSKNEWVCEGDAYKQRFVCHHPELAEENGIAHLNIWTGDSIPADKVYVIDPETGSGMEAV